MGINDLMRVVLRLGLVAARLIRNEIIILLHEHLLRDSSLYEP